MPTALITGASRGLGLEFTRQYAAAGWDVIACARDPARATELEAIRKRAGGLVSVEMLDVTNPQHLEWVVGKYANTAIDLLINNAGDIGPRGPHRELLFKQMFGSLDYAAWLRVLEINTLAPIRIAEAFAGHVERSEQKKMVFVSSTTGSNAEGVYPVFAYCSSKAALNKCVTMLAGAVRERGIIAAAVCPGHVRTELGGQGATLDPPESIAGLRKVIARLTLADSGSFTRYNGERIAW
ncbi:MAG: SDR family oxidoreductase [Burkholderiaceae bacterium]|jgi:NAD(P)-dependent dehydrogenase (short-subunit alcohol dehydrogenase family)|nr:SDR family oxidoreductase [Burkholderiaceae bacterium]